jgi:hypothetical protein
VPLGIKAVVIRPGTKEGGREEEENRSGISTGETGVTHNRKTGTVRGVVITSLREPDSCG